MEHYIGIIKLMKIFVTWSGGLDSTYLLRYLSERGHEVHCGYIQLSNNEEKSKRELKAIKRIKRSGYLEKYNIQYHGVVSVVEWRQVNNNFSIAQPLFWLPNVVNVVDSTFDAVALAYVINDAAVSFLNEIKFLWKAINNFTYNQKIKLLFPLIKTSKSEIWDYLKEDGVDKLVTWCETPHKNDTDVCNCGSCKRMVYEGIDTDTSLILVKEMK